MHAHTLGCPTQERRPPGLFHFCLGNSDKHSLLAVTGWGGIKRWPPVSGITWCQFEEVGLFWQQSLATNNKLFLWKTSKKVAWLHKTRDIDHITVVVLFCLFEFAYFIMICILFHFNLMIFETPIPRFDHGTCPRFRDMVTSTVILRLGNTKRRGEIPVENQMNM